MLGTYFKGFFLVFWEIFININANLNVAILYSFTGRFELAKSSINNRWLLLYVAVYVYGIWDSYRTSIDLNKFSILADREKSTVFPFTVGSFGINYLDKRNPWISAVWSSLMPGLGQFYGNRLINGFIILAWWIIFAYNSNMLEAIACMAAGDFTRASVVTNPEWLLFIPSLYVFSIYGAYVNTVEYNNMFEKEQAQFLKVNYQSRDFIMPE